MDKTNINGIPWKARRFLSGLTRRTLKLGPMHQILRELRRRGVEVEKLHALEVFGGTGEFHTSNYFPYVASLEAWEVRAELEAILKRNLPGAQIRIVDSYEEVKHHEKRFDFIVVDNPTGFERGHCEHFDLFPYVFRIMSEEAVLVLNVLPKVGCPAKTQSGPWQFYPISPLQMNRRTLFYSSAEGALTAEQMARTYGRIAADCGFALDWYFEQPQHYLLNGPRFVNYLVIKFRDAMIKSVVGTGPENRTAIE